MNRIEQLKNELTKRHLSFYTEENGRLKRYDINSNEEWISKHIDKEWKNSDNIYCIDGFDFVSMGMIEVDTSKILWDEINGFYDHCSAYFKQEINKCEETLKFISDSWLEAQNNKTLQKSRNKQTYKIYRHSEKHKKL